LFISTLSWNRLITNFVIQFWHIKLRFLSVKQMVLRLLDNRRHAVELPTVRIGFHNFHGCPSRRTPVHYPTFAYNVIHSANNLWNEITWIREIQDVIKELFRRVEKLPNDWCERCEINLNLSLLLNGYLYFNMREIIYLSEREKAKKCMYF